MPDRTKLERWGRPTISRTLEGRLRVTRRWNLKGNWAERQSLDTETFAPVGKQDDEFPEAFLVSEPTVAPRGEGAEEMVLTEVYEEVTDELTEIGGPDSAGGPSISTDQNGRRTVTRRFVVKRTVSDSVKFGEEGVTKDPDSSRFPNHYLQRQQVDDRGFITRVTRTYVEITGSPVQVGQDDLATDQDGRRTLRRRFLILSGASYTPPSVGDNAATVDGANFVYAGERRSGDKSVTRVTRRYIEATDTPVQVGEDNISTSQDGRRSLTQIWVMRAAAVYTPPDIGSSYNSIYALGGEQVTRGKTLRRISRRYIEATAQSQLVGNPDYSRGEDDRKQIARTLIRLANATEPGDLDNSIGVLELEGCVLARISATQDAAICRIRETYLEATDTPVEIGRPDIRQIPGTKSPATGLTDAGARQWTHRFLVKAGSGDISSDHWLDYNAAGPLGANQNLVNQQIGHRGKGFAIINRVFVEVPGEWTESRRTRYRFPGSYFLSGSGGSPDPSLRVEPVRRWVTAHITETYSTTEPSPSNEVFEVFRWLSTRLELPGQPPRLQVYRGYLGSVAWTGDYEESGSSDPSIYPTGMTVIESDVRLWQGRIWRRRDVSIDFGGV